MDMSSQDDSLSEKTQANFPDDIKLLYCTEINGEDELRNKLESILQAVDEGKSAEEIERMSGIKVTQLPKQSAEQELYDNLNDASVRARITDPVDFEEVTLMMQLNEEMRRAKRANNEPIVNSQLHDIMRDIQVDLSQTTVSVSLLDEIDRLDKGVTEEVAARVVGGSSLDELLVLKSTTQLPASSTTSALSPIPAVESKTDAFASLLRTAISDSSDAADAASTEVKQRTLAVMEAGDLASLDLGSLLGEALGTLSSELGVDEELRRELASDPSQMQAIMQGSISELAANMRDLDAKSAELYGKLTNLEADLRRETEEFDEKKQLELSDLLDDQNRLRKELAVSQEKMRENSGKLDELMATYEREADVITALALFPLKSGDKRIAFIIGLALVFKVPFDASMLFATRSLDVSDLFGLITQSLLAFTCFFHYGLIQAIGRKPLTSA